MRKLRFWVGLSLLTLVRASAQQESFSSRANLVPVPTLVRDGAGNAIYGLTADDFIVQDDQTVQVVHLDQAAEADPISLVIAIECGRRAKREFDRIRGLAAMLDPILSDGRNEAAVLLFDRQLRLVENFTHNSEKLEQNLRDLHSGDHGAAILDAAAYAARLLSRRPEGRQRVLLLISETRDHGSQFSKLEDLVGLIGENNISVYALSFSPYFSQQADVVRGANQDEWSPSIDFLEKMGALRQALRGNTPKTLTWLTGGEYEIFHGRGGFETDLIAFSNHLHSRYRLSFEPKDPHPGLHQIQVSLRRPDPGASVLYRRSYWAGNVR
jgi:VWFA-related protein